MHDVNGSDNLRGVQFIYHSDKRQQESQYLDDGGTDDETSNFSDDLVDPELNFQQLTERQKQFIVLSGYKACTEEAIRFLVEEEGLSRTDPVVVGLERHLHQHEMNLEYYRLQRKQYFATMSSEDEKYAQTEAVLNAPQSPDRPLSYFIGCPLIQWPSANSSPLSSSGDWERTFESNSDVSGQCSDCVSPTPSL